MLSKFKASMQDTLQLQVNHLEEKYQCIAEKETDIVQKDKAIATEREYTEVKTGTATNYGST